MIKRNYYFELIKNEENIVSFKLKDSDIMAFVFVLEEDIFRVMFMEKTLKVKNTWWVSKGKSDIPKEGIDKFDISGFEKPNYQCEILKDSCTIETTKLKLSIQLNGFKASWYDKAKNTLIANDRKTQNYNFFGSLGDGVFHYLERNKKEQYYGLGERSGDTNRHGRRFKMMNVDPMGYDAKTTDPLYKHIPFYITRNKETGISFGIFYDNMSTSEFDMGKELDNYHSFYRYYTAVDGDLDYYMILGPTISDVTKKFSELTGRTIMPPKWSIGYSGSTMTYTDAKDAQKRLLTFIELCRKHDIPCDSFQLSSGYTSIGDKRYVFNWNFDKVPNPEKLADDFHKSGLKLCANIKPALLFDHPLFQELEKEKMFILSKDGTETEMCQFWDELGAYIDFTNPKSFDWWKSKVKEQLLAYGIDSTWNDNNEYEVWDKNAKVFGFGTEMNIEKVKPLQTLLMMKASYEAQKEYNKNIRPYLISRSGCPGMQRYVQTWSGDNRTDFETIKYNIKMGIGLSLSGIYNFGHDVGGFAGNAPDKEMFVRWVQNGIFHPRFTIHSWNDDKTVNEPWMYEEVLEPIRDAIKFRSKLTPFIYDLLYKAHKAFEPIIRPTFYNYEEDEQTFEENDDFMLGDTLLIGSIVTAGAREREIYLPKCEEGWYDYNSHMYYEGGQTITVLAPLETIPLFIKAGSILPVNIANITFESKNDDIRGIELFPCKGISHTEYVFYEDDGYSNDFQKGIFGLIKVMMQTDDETIYINVSKEGSYQLPYQDIEFILPKNETRTLMIRDFEL